MNRKFAHSATQAALELGEAAVNSAVTIAARMPILAAHLVNPSAAGLAEWQTAASEKVAATWEGAMAASLQCQDFFWRSLMAPVTPFGFAQEAMVVARAAVNPAQVSVRANARRFSQD